MTFDEKQEKYAELAVRTGINIQKGQELVINAPIVAIELVRKITKVAYLAGAKQVYYRWNDDELYLTKFTYATDEALTTYPSWEAEGLEELAKRGAGFLTIKTPALDLFKDVDPEKMSKSNKATSEMLHAYREYQIIKSTCVKLLLTPSASSSSRVISDPPSIHFG